MSFRFDLTDLRLFLQIVESGSITAGAEATEFGLSAASARILAMESSLGVPLLRRQARGVRATAAGQTLVIRARGLLKQIELLYGGLAEHGQGVKVTVRLLCETVAMHEVVPERLASYLSVEPQVNLHVEELPGHEVVAALADGMADVGIVRESTDVSGLESYIFHEDRLVLVTPPRHALALAAEAGPISLATADPYDVIGLSRGVELQDTWDSRVAQRGKQLNYRIRVESFDEQSRLVAKGAGIALMPNSTAERHSRSLNIEIVPLDEVFASFSLRLCVRQLEQLPSATQRLVSCLLKVSSY
jgi:DNA-binding transcriptional LysR family regulator